MRTGFTEILELDAPLMQAPVGGAAGPELAANVSNAGGLGSIAVWFFGVEQAASAVRATAALTARPFAVNLRADLYQHGHVAATIAAGAKAINLFWGDPTPYAAAIRGAGAKLICTVASTDEARQALDAGADVLIAQGWEAGGHVRGTLSTLALVPAVVDVAGRVPVVAAGGIVDGRGLAAVLVLGAAGAGMGTRFVASNESRAHPDYKQALVAARQTDTVYLRDLFDGGWPDAPHRVLRNSTVRRWEDAGSPPAGSRPNEKEIVAVRADGEAVERYHTAIPRTGMTGDIAALAHYAGQGVEGIHEILPAAEIVRSVVRDAQSRLAERR